MPSLWIVPEKAGGIRTYSDVLLARLGAEARAVSTLPDPSELAYSTEDLIHLQHEFGLFGSKLPGRYRFPKWFASARRATPDVKWIATAHTVLDENWRYRTSGRGWKAVPFAILNLFAPLFRGSWMTKTWAGFDGVIVHSELQREVILRSGAPKVAVIPHFVPHPPAAVPERSTEPTVLVFGYFSPEKGQDIAIKAWTELGDEAPRLILAGGIRRPEDRRYYDECMAEIQRRGLTEKVTVTGYLPDEALPDYFSIATLVLAPFRETSGSGSLATALGYGAAILASDLPLNREIETRVPGSLFFFRSESSESLAAAIRNLLDHPELRAQLRTGAKKYAETYSVERIAEMHREFYDQILAPGRTS